MRNSTDSQTWQLECDKEERRWIHHLAMIVPKGLNLGYSYSLKILVFSVYGEKLYTSDYTEQIRPIYLDW